MIAAPPRERCPVFLITGYAAAGKTHFVNLLLSHCARLGLRVGVVSHRQAEEFGIHPTSIDAPSAAFYEEVYDFGSGCLCCSPRGDMTRVLTQLPNTEVVAAGSRSAETAELFAGRFGIPKAHGSYAALAADAA